MERGIAWKTYTESDYETLESVAAGYIDFISDCKTERTCTTRAIQMAEQAGYVSLDEAIRHNKQLNPGDKVWAANYGKALILAQIGARPIEEGLNILGAHIDSPRLDIKQNPVYETRDFAYMDTHYYGGIKSYQWVTMPLALYGVVVKKDGTVVDVCVGDKPEDPVFCVTDLLPHLGDEQMKKPGNKVIEGEDLDILVGSKPLVISEDDAAGAESGAGADAEGGNAETYQQSLTKMAAKEGVKANLLSLLLETYNIEEEDFLSAELEVVPAGRARELGFDRSMVIGYGQDDRVCAYPSLLAQLEVENPERTSVCILVDKEEIGSVGATGMTSRFFENTIAEIMALAGQGGDLTLRRALANSRMLSSDVSAGYDPTYSSVFEEKNSAFCGKGLVFNKYVGARGKSGSNDANAEYMAFLRNVMDQAAVSYQTAEIGKVNAGGGGTIAYILAEYGMSVIDSGVPVLSMHAPWEVTSKADIYEAYKGYKAFLMA
ncbi:MAG: aminopeptidase [Anaerotardibacter sp.]